MRPSYFQGNCYFPILLSAALIFLSLAPLVAAESETTGPSLRLHTTYGSDTHRSPEFEAGETLVVQAKLSRMKPNQAGEYQFAIEAQLLDATGKTIEKTRLRQSPAISNHSDTVNLSLPIPAKTPPGKYLFLATLHDLSEDTKTTAELEIKLLSHGAQEVTELRLAKEPVSSLRPEATFLLANVSSELIMKDGQGVLCTMIIWDEKKQLVGEPVSAIVTRASHQADKEGRPFNLALPLPKLPTGNYQIRLIAPNEVGRESTQYQINYRVPFYLSGIDLVR